MFHSARIKLTLWYLFIIMLVSGFFSMIVYRGFTKELGRGFRIQSLSRPPGTALYFRDRNGITSILPFVIDPDELPPQEFMEIIELAKHRFAIQLIIINGGILILAGTAGYFLAGKTLRPIEQMVDEQKRFVADASHELRTPLTSMKTEVEVALRDKKLKLEGAKELLKSNLAEVDKIKNFTDYLLALSRFEANGHDLQMEEVDLKEAAKQAIEKNVTLAKNKKIKILENLEEVTIRGNGPSLVELLSILVNNAVKYSESGKNINVKVIRSKKGAVVEVADEGIGISDKDIPHIFDRFYRADISRNKSKADGFGLGLAIAKSIADLHKADIKVKSEVGVGSIFRVTFPS